MAEIRPGAVSRFGRIAALPAMPLLALAAACGSGRALGDPSPVGLTLLRAGAEPARDRSPFVWGIQGHPGKQAAYGGAGEELLRQFDYLDSLQVSHYRMDLYPDSAGRVDPVLDGALDLADSRGIAILPVLVARPDQAGSQADNYRRGFAIGYGFAAVYPGRFSHVEAGNELENLALRYTPDARDPSVLHYLEGSALDHYRDTALARTTAFLRGMTEGIHQAAPGTRVIVNASYRHYAFFEALDRDGVPFDVYGYHWYSEMGDFVSDVLPHLPDTTREVWITEANRRNTAASYDDPAGQAEWIARYAREVSALPRVRALFVYELYEERGFGETEPEAYYGLVRCEDAGCGGSRVLKPGFYAYRDAIRRERQDALRSLWLAVSARMFLLSGGVAQLVEQGTFNP